MNIYKAPLMINICFSNNFTKCTMKMVLKVIILFLIRIVVDSNRTTIESGYTTVTRTALIVCVLCNAGEK